MAAYLLAQVEVHDMEQYRKYTAQTPALIEKYGGRFLVRGGEVVTLEGDAPASRLVLIEFPSLQTVQDFYNSAAYQEVKQLRLPASTASFLALDGVD
ncbi:MAG: DUF1330 domain-containing protein [Anaerolineaceae bacterium]|nr:DUF1330 domain-containing protein [Anaerolineaceae bacterium]MDE0327836.1 DUF1330 domain-containing protein [Anaerolineaceae bacterium]